MEYTIENIIESLTTLAEISGIELITNRAADEEITAYQNEHNLSFPPEFKQWLKACNGVSMPNVIELCGINLEGCGGIEISKFSEDYEELGWRKNNWITISHDYCGDFYVLDGINCINGKHPVYFIDQCDFDFNENSTPTYIAASGLFEFLYHFINQEIMLQQAYKSGAGPETGWNYVDDQWPFNEQFVIKHDPDILAVKLQTGIDLPWEA